MLIAPHQMRLLDTASKFALFSVFGLKDEKLTKKQTYMKIETCKLYSSVFEHLSQISSKSILIISSCTVSKLVHFLRRSVYECILGLDQSDQSSIAWLVVFEGIGAAD